MTKTRITIRLDQPTARQLQARANALGKSESEVVRDALISCLAASNGPQTALEVACRAGIIGCADGLPPDLSTNKSYLEGFGR
jgi:plasmid stability protein